LFVVGEFSAISRLGLILVDGYDGCESTTLEGVLAFPFVGEEAFEGDE